MTHLDFEITMLAFTICLLVLVMSKTIVRLYDETNELSKQIKEIKDNIYIVGGEEDGSGDNRY